MDELRSARTLSILREMAKGRRLTLPDGHAVAMAEDMTIGFVVDFGKGPAVSSMSEMTLRDLDELLTANDIGFPV